MARCRECGTEIPEGTEYCENCLSKLNTVKDSESYLDSLLNAVMTEEPKRREVFPRKKKEKSSPVSVPQKEADIPEQTKEDQSAEPDVPEEIKKEKPAEADIPKEAEEVLAEMDIPEEEAEEEIAEVDIPEEEAEEEIAEADIPEEEAEEALAEVDIPEEEAAEEIAEVDIPEEEAEEVLAEVDIPEEEAEEALAEVDIPEEEAEEVLAEMDIPEEEAEEVLAEADIPEELTEPEVSKNVKREEEELMEGSAPKKVKREEGKLPDLKNYSIFQEIDEADIMQMFDADLNLQEEPESPQEEPESVDSSESDDFADLFADSKEAGPEPLQEEPEPVDSSESGDFADLFADGEEAGPESLQEEPEPVDSSEFGDFADLFAGDEENGIEFQSGIGEAESMEKVESMADPELDTLLSGLDEMPAAEDDGSGSISGENELEPDLEKFLAGFSEGEDASGAAEEEKRERLQAADNASGETPETGKKKKERGEKKKKEKKEGRISAWYHRLFDNVKVDPSKIKPQPTKEEIEAKKKAAQEAKERSKEEKEAQLAEKKEQARQAKAEKQRQEREAKAEKKAKKLEEAKLLLEEMQGTRINRAGASIVFIFFAMIAVVILFGTDIFSYQLSIRNASAEFERDEYTRAYNEIFGLDIQEEDILLYDRIMTVMYVQKQLNSYYNYYEMKDYPKALDSLLKGLQRYEKYIGLAVELDIDSDLDSVRSKILTEIDVSFSLSEQEAMAIMQSDSQLEYSIRVYDAAERAE